MYLDQELHPYEGAKRCLAKPSCKQFVQFDTFVLGKIERLPGDLPKDHQPHIGQPFVLLYEIPIGFFTLGFGIALGQAIADPRNIAVIRESGGKMFMSEKKWEALLYTQKRERMFVTFVQLWYRDPSARAHRTCIRCMYICV